MPSRHGWSPGATASRSVAEGTRDRGHRPVALGLMAASGFAGLGYQIIWTQQLALWLGHETPAVMAVVAAFFGGLAAGSWLLAGRIERSTRPGIWYAACEAAIGLWGLLLIALMPLMGARLQSLIALQAADSQHWLVAFGCFVL